jgi:D-glycero-D-manno-heptose 1,7-bisphosphate phosphatase
MQRVAFLDRDGVINVDTDFVYRWEDFQFCHKSIEAMQWLVQKNIGIVIVTNQSGIARGYYSEGQYKELEASLIDALNEVGVPVMAIYHCPHHPDGMISKYANSCDCRKPKPGMLLRAAYELSIDLSQSFLVGDKFSDIQAAHAAGVLETYLVSSTLSGVVSLPTGTFQCVSSLWDCIQLMMRESA